MKSKLTYQELENQIVDYKKQIETLQLNSASKKQEKENRANELIIAKEKAKKSENLLKQAQVIANLGIYELDIASGKWVSSEILDKIFGIDTDYDKSVEGWESIIHPEWQKIMEDYFRQEVLGNKTKFHKEYKIIRKNDGAERWVLGIGNLQFNADDQPISMIGTIQDITERKNIEKALKRSENVLNESQKISKIGGWEYNVESGEAYYSNEVYNIHGITNNGVPLNVDGSLEFYHLEDRGLVLESFTKAISHGIPYDIDVRFINKRSENMWVKTVGKPISKNGKIVSVLGTLLDITERKEAEKTINNEILRFQKTLDAIDAIVYVADIHTYELLFLNQYAKNIFGDNLNGKCYSIIQKGQTEPCEFCTNHLLVDKSRKPNRPYVWDFQNTITKQWYQNSDVVIEWTDGRLVRLEVAINITDRKLAEQALKESEEKLRESNKTKDKFFSIIAHDLRSPFNSALGFSEILKNDFDEYDLEEKKKFIGLINTGLNRAYYLLNNLLLWSSSQRGVIGFNPEKINLYLLFVETIKLLNQSAGDKSIKIHTQTPEDLCINADKQMLSTIIRNLLSNAIKFTPKRGEININARLISDKNNSEATEITISDNGVGIPSKIQSKLFDVGQDISTKGTDNETGTGLGLVLCKEFVEKHGGEIWVKSEIDKGSQFIFTIPIIK